MPGLPKLRIGEVLEIVVCRQTRCRDRLDEVPRRCLAYVDTSVSAELRVIDPGASEYVDVGRGDRVAAQARLDALEPEGRQHQQTRDERDEQPRHKDEVNTAKISLGSRKVHVKDRSTAGSVGTPQ